MPRLLFALLCIPLALTQVACSVNPATGARSFTTLSWEDEKKLGAEAAPQFTAEFGGEVPDAGIQSYIDRIGARLIAHIEPGVPELEWEFTLLDSEVINAFALPGGKVFMTRGLASLLENEAELAGVLGHEIGHVTARHANQRMSKQIGFNLILGAAAVGVGAADSGSDIRKYGQVAVPALAVGGNVMMLKYGRDEESEADMLGMRYMHKAGYHPRAQRSVMEVLLQASEGGPRPIEWLSTHPYPETRIERINQILAESYPDADRDPALRTGEDEYRSSLLNPLAALASSRPDQPDTISAAALIAWPRCCAGDEAITHDGARVE